MAEQKNNDIRSYWLLIAGTTESSSSINFSDKKRDNGNYLNGVKSDLANMEQYINNEEYDTVQNVIRDMKDLKCWTVLDRIKKCAKECKQKNGKSVRIYYTGHGETNTGNWCFKDGVINLKQVIDAVKQEYNNCDIIIHCDCCYSGNWAITLSSFGNKYKSDIYVNASSWPGMVSWDTVDGGMYTLKYVEKKQAKEMKQLLSCSGRLYSGKFKMI